MALASGDSLLMPRPAASVIVECVALDFTVPRGYLVVSGREGLAVLESRGAVTAVDMFSIGLQDQVILEIPRSFCN